MAVSLQGVASLPCPLVKICVICFHGFEWYVIGNTKYYLNNIVKIYDDMCDN